MNLAGIQNDCKNEWTVSEYPKETCQETHRGLEVINSLPFLWLDNSARDIMVLFNEICNSCLCSISKRGPLFSSAGFPKAVTLPVVPNQDDGRWTYTELPLMSSPSSILYPKALPHCRPSLFWLWLTDPLCHCTKLSPLMKTQRQAVDPLVAGADSFTVHGW